MQFSRLFLCTLAFSCVLVTLVQAGCDDNAALLLQCQRQLSSLPLCPANTLPVRNRTTCCFNCRVGVPTQVCTQAQITNCANNLFSSLPICTSSGSGDNTRVNFNTTTCCPNCRPAPPSGNNAPNSTTGRCSDDAVKACFQAAPVCGAGERPVFTSGYCCPSCVPPAVRCNATATVSCRAARPVCDTDEEPVASNDDCCRSCRPAPVNCTGGCPAGQICVRAYNESRSEVTRPGVCRPVAAVRFFIAVRAAANAAARAAFANYSCADMVDLLTTIVNRFCAQTVNADRCNNFAEFVSNLPSLNATCNGAGSLNVTVTLPAPQPPTAPSAFFAPLSASSHMNTLAGGDSVSLFVSAALSDSASSGDYSGSTDSSTNDPSPAPTVLVSSAVTLLCVALVTLLVLF